MASSVAVSRRWIEVAMATPRKLLGYFYYTTARAELLCFGFGRPRFRCYPLLCLLVVCTCCAMCRVVVVLGI